MRPFDYDPRDKSKKWKAKAEMREKRLLLKVDRHFNPTEDASPIKTLLGENAMKDVVPKSACVQQGRAVQRLKFRRLSWMTSTRSYPRRRKVRRRVK